MTSSPECAALCIVLAHQTQKNLSNARAYFREHLEAGDYYSANNRIAGEWAGRGAERLNLRGCVTEEEFLSLCENRHPHNPERLTVRTKSGTRRVFEDFVFSPPKSVSLAALVNDDGCVLAAHRAAVREALTELEQLAGCRIRKGRDSDRVTGNVIAACFEHETSRALDPQLHTHCIVFNATWDESESRWKALQNHGILQERRYLTEVYRNRLAAELRSLGYALNHGRNGFEIGGIAGALCERFSKRREEIASIADVIQAAQPGANIHEIRENIAHRVRDRKIKEINRDELRRFWQGQLTPQESAQLAAIRPGTHWAPREQRRTEEAFEWSLDHLLERKSVVRERELFAEALAHKRGEVDLDELRNLVRTRGLLRTNAGELTRRDVLEKEWEIVCWARDGQGASAPLNPDYKIPEDSTLSEEQRAAVSYLLSRSDEVMIFRGGAGTGKSFTLGEVKRGLDAGGYNVVTLAPQRKQVMALQEDGFGGAETVASFLQRKRLATGSVVIVDEAGLLGVRDMHEIMLLVRTTDSALILSGDTRQHSGVEAGDALRAIEEHSGIGWVSLESIQRQKEWAMRRLYRSAVKAISEGRVTDGFRWLARAGAVVEQPIESRYAALAEEFLAILENGKSCLVVSPTWREIKLVTGSIRAGLVTRGALGADRSELQVLENLDLTEAQKSGGPQHFEPDCHLVFHRKCGRIGRNATLRYARHEGARVVATDEAGTEHHSEPAAAANFSVMRKRSLEVRLGESLLIQANAESTDGRKLANGELVQVAAIRKRGAIELADGRTIPENFREFTYGYAVTSHASQGLTVDHVLLAMDSESGPAVNRKQFYVSSSRGREGLRIYTDDAEALGEQIRRSGHRPLALEAVEAARRLGIRPEIAGSVIGKATSLISALQRLTTWRAQCAAQMGHRKSIHVDLWQ